MAYIGLICSDCLNLSTLCFELVHTVQYNEHFNCAPSGENEVTLHRSDLIS